MKFLLSVAAILTLLAACNPDTPDPLVGAASPSQQTSEGDASGQGESASGTVSLRGMFRYLADAPQFRDCTSGTLFPVAMAGPYIELERTYLNSGIEPGGPLMIELQGHVLERPVVDSNTNEIMLMIDSFQVISNPVDCAPAISAGLPDTYWKLLEVDGLKVNPSSGGKEAHLVLEATEFRVRGFSGCNSFFGQYTLDGEKLTFSALGSTMMACPEGMEQEQAFLGALGSTDTFKLNGLVLDLYSGDQRVARLEAVR